MKIKRKILVIIRNKINQKIKIYNINQSNNIININQKNSINKINHKNINNKFNKKIKILKIVFKINNKKFKII